MSGTSAEATSPTAQQSSTTPTASAGTRRLLQPLLHSDSLSVLVFSSTAAFVQSRNIVTRCGTHPLDTLKTRIQFSTKPLSLVSALTSQPISTLYRGLGVSLVFSVPALSIYLSSYDACKSRLSAWEKNGASGGSGSVWVHATAGAAAECVSGLFWTPMEVIKSKLQVGVGANGNVATSTMSTVGLVRDILATQGVQGLFKGYWISLGVFVPYTVIYFVTYEKLKSFGMTHLVHRASRATTQSLTTKTISLRKVNNTTSTYTTCNVNNASPPASPPTTTTTTTPSTPSTSVVNPFFVYLVSSAMAGSLAGAASNVIDVVKTRIQVSGFGGGAGEGLKTTSITKPMSSIGAVLKTAIHMYRHEGGIWAFTRGMAARVLWIAPSVTISMTVFEVLKDWRAGLVG
ncbi:hypothetical protein HDU76_005337 [Blyttiomyces sp. JEL0837]|nr:hypothetical protein HDU76_005337 [Blyttiomyces sp. JEL0837]